MVKSGKKYTIVGNWKMNPDTLDDAKKIFSAISRRVSKYSKVHKVIAPPAPFITTLAGKKISLCAQDVSSEPRGARTGSISALEVKSAGANFVIIGHSERRAAGDSDEIISKKVSLALAAGLRVILCVGETQRDGHAMYLREVREQIVSVFSVLPDKKSAQWITVAYEPVWAVGGSYENTPKPGDIHEMVIFIKKVVSEILDKKTGLRTPVFYGGSLDSENALTILRDGAVDGLLVGRQSLDPVAFAKIIEHANKLS
jgi:triosephosphate isomerase